MFKQKLKEILELTLEAADKTETYISYHYGNQSESLSVFVGEEVKAMAEKSLDRMLELAK